MNAHEFERATATARRLLAALEANRPEAEARLRMWSATPPRGVRLRLAHFDQPITTEGNDLVDFCLYF